MEISEEMYLKLQNQISELQRQVNDMPTKRVVMTDYVTEAPITGVGTTTDAISKLEYSKWSYGDEWKCFLSLAKYLCTKTRKFKMTEIKRNDVIIGRKFNVVKSEEQIKKLNEMKNYEVKYCADFLNEVVPIYNKYYKKMHKTVSVMTECDIWKEMEIE